MRHSNASFVSLSSSEAHNMSICALFREISTLEVMIASSDTLVWSFELMMALRLGTIWRIL